MSSSLTPPVFSSSTLWAAPSRDWIIAPKVKPGRKPTNDPPLRNDGNDPNNDSRRIQNRAAQRAFRERKQSQLADLQARVQSYEQGEIERSVALQNVSKRLKEENEALRLENQLLKDKIARMERQGLAQSKNRREQPLDNLFSAIAVPNKRIKRSEGISSTAERTSLTHSPTIHLAQPSQDIEDLSSPSYIPDSHQIHNEQNRSPKDALKYTLNQVDLESSSSTPSFGSCGLCDEVIPCLCRDIAPQGPSGRVVGFKEHLSTEIFSQSERLVCTPAEETLQSSILDNLPPYQPAVPLPRKRASGSSRNSIFPVIHLPSQEAKCTGDPSNCLACADDAFGKAFCTEIGRSISSRRLCVGCPCSQNKSNVSGPHYVCCGSPENCRSCPLASQISSSTDPGTMPTNEAWKKIKEHPNVSFADLSLLAEVVARRSKCTGPTVIISPAPGEATPERVASPDTHSQPYTIQDLLGVSSNADDRVTPVPVRLTSPQHSISVGCGHKGPHEVEAAGVQDALRLLDKIS